MKIKLDKKKKIQIAIVVAALVAIVACTFGGMKLFAQSQQEKAQREENGVAPITDVFHDQANEYITPDEPTEKEDITLRIRTAKYNVTKAQIQYTTDKGLSWKTADMKFEKHDDTGYYDFFKGTIPAQSETIHYRFICSNNDEKNTVFVDGNLLPEKAEMGTYETCFVVIPGFSTPDWAKGALWYSLMPDAFYNGDTTNDLANSDNNMPMSWNNVHLGLADKYGGDLAGVAAKTDYFKQLGVDGVYMNPVFRSSQNAGYGGIDFMQIEPSFGNEESFREMCDTLHKNDLRVMMDAVLTFTATDSIYVDANNRYPFDGAYESEDSKYKDLFAYYEWPDNYLTTWGGVGVNHSNKEAQELFYSTKDSFMQHYTLAPYNVDGWRFDCGGWLWGNTEDGNEYANVVMAEIRDYLKEASPEVLLISENDTGNLVNGVWDGQWNLWLIDAITRYAEGITNEAGLQDILRQSVKQLPRSVALCMTNMRSQHDKDRVQGTKFYNDKASVLVQMNYIGSPSIYYGEEIGLNRKKDAGVGDAGSFYAMEWDEKNWDYQKLNLYRAMGELKSKYTAVKTGAFKDILVDTKNNVYAFGRWDDKGTVITIASQNKETVEVELNARSLSVADGTVFTDWLTGKQYTVDEEGKLLADVIPGGTVLVKGKKASKYLEQSEEAAKVAEVNFDEFEGKNVMFTEENKNASLKDGKLILKAKKDMVFRTTDGKTDDWTFKTKLESSTEKDAYAGVLCMSDENQFIATGRTEYKGKPVIFIGRTTNGKVLVDKYVKDSKPESPIVIQLQRVGTTYSAAYSYDDKNFELVGSSVFANYSSEKVGVFAQGMKKAVFDYVSFGDSIHDGKSVNTPYASGVIDMNYSTNVTASTDESMKIVSGEWTYADEGYLQASKEGIAQMGIDNKTYYNVRANVTLELEDGKGYVGVGFGKKEYNTEQEDGFLLKYTKDEKLVLMKNGKKMADATVRSIEGDALRVTIEAEDGAIRVYAGQDSERVMYLEDTGYKSGYICFYTCDAKARVMNFRISSLEAQWLDLSGYQAAYSSMTVFGGANTITCAGITQNAIDYYGATTRTGVAVTDFAATAEIEIRSRQNPSGTAAEGGVLMSASEGKSKANAGVSISLVEGGNLSLKSNGKEVGKYSLGEEVKKARILFVRKDQQCQVWVQGVKDPVITWKDTEERGGVFQLYSVNTYARYAKLGLEDIHDIAIADSNLVKLWKAGTMPVPAASAYVEDFESQSAWSNLIKLNPWHGEWKVQDGVLSCVSARGYVACVAIHNRIFKDFEMSFKYRFDASDSSGWAHVIFRKPRIDSSHAEYNYCILMSLSGDIQLSNGKETVAKGRVENFKVNDWYQMKVVFDGAQIQVYDGDRQIISYTDPAYGTTYEKEGFISFDSNQTRYSIDDVIIRPLG